MSNLDAASVTLTLSIDQANAVSTALDLFSRIGMGDIQEVANLARHGLLSKRTSDSHCPVDIDTIERIDELLNSVKELLGHSRNSSFGIAAQGVPLIARRAWEVKKVIEKAVWDHCYPGDRSTVFSDGLSFRLTQDTPPSAILAAVPVKT